MITKGTKVRLKLGAKIVTGIVKDIRDRVKSTMMEGLKRGENNIRALLIELEDGNRVMKLDRDVEQA